MAEGGKVPEDMKLWDLPEMLRKFAAMEKPGAMTEDAYDARLLGARRPMRASGGRRPEALNASRDVNMPAQLLRGWAAGTLGLPGDLEGLARMAIPGVSNKPFFPTSDDYDSILPGRDMTPAGRFAGGAGTLFGGAGLPAIARGVQKGSKAVAKGALETLARGMEGSGPLSGVLAPVAPRYAVRPRGGNFTNPRTEDLGGWYAEGNSPQEAWATKVLRNYVKRDLGAPTDPLLALEKELPGLHLPEGHLAEAGGDVERLYDAASGTGRTTYDQGAFNMLRRHHDLSGDARLTPWGRISDAEVLSGTAGQDLALELSQRWPLQNMYPDAAYGEATGAQSLSDLQRHVGNIRDRFEPVGHYPTVEKLDAYRKQIDDAMANDWRAKKPEDPLYSLMAGGGERLGFDHIMDYIDAATSGHKEIPDALGYLSTDEAGLRRILAAGNASPALREALGLKDAGLLLDPASLDRVSVPDMVRKVAKWNEYMTSKKAGTADQLMQGARVHKEYGPESGEVAGMKWVEFGTPDYEPTIEDALKAGYRVEANKYKPGQFLIRSDDGRPVGYYDSETAANEGLLDSVRDELRAAPLRTGLKAEGDAMGHCVGGYCDDVLNRGTKIYSLRDAKGQPHVTVEVGPSDLRDYLRTLPHPAPRGVQNPHTFTTFSDYVNDMRQGNGDYEDFAKTLMTKHNVPPPPLNIVQIKGKGNAAPVEKYLPAVQDFVKSQPWGRVGDLKNTGLTKWTGGKTNIRDPIKGGTKNQQQRRVHEDISMPEGYMTAEDAMRFVMDQGVPEDMARRHVGNFRTFDREYAQGGSVQADPNGPGPGFLPRTFEEAVDYAERVYAAHA